MMDKDLPAEPAEDLEARERAALGDLRKPLARPNPQDLVETKAASSPPDPHMGRDSDRDFLLRYGAG